MKLDYRLVSSVLAAVVFACYSVDISDSQQIDGSDDAANVGRDLDLYFLDDEDSRDPRQSQQLTGDSHHITKRDTPGAARGRKASNARSGSDGGRPGKRKEQTIAESLMGSGDSDSEERESTERGGHSKVSLPSPPHTSDDEDDEDFEGSGDFFKPHSKPKATGTTRRPGRINGPPPLLEDTGPGRTQQIGGGHSTSTEIPASTSTLSSTSTVWSTASSTTSTRRPPAAPASTTSMPEDDEDSEDDEGDYDGSGAGELATGHISGAGGVFGGKDRNKKKQDDGLLPGGKKPDDSSSSKHIIGADEEYYDEDDDEDDSDLDDGEDVLSPPSGGSSSTSSPSTTSSTSSTIAPSTTSTTTTTSPAPTTTSAIPSSTMPATTSSGAGSALGGEANAGREKDADDGGAGGDDDDDAGDDDDDDDDDNDDAGDDDGLDSDGGAGTGGAGTTGDSTILDKDKHPHGGKPASGHLPDGNGVVAGGGGGGGGSNSHDDDAAKKEIAGGKSGADRGSSSGGGGGGHKWAGDNSRESGQENDIAHDIEGGSTTSGEVLLRHKATQRPSTLLGQPGILVAVMGGAVVGLLLAILCVMFVVYRMRKKDEGSYPLGKRNHDDHFSTHRRNYMRPSANREFYA